MSEPLASSEGSEIEVCRGLNVIEVVHRRGSGTERSPVRLVLKFYSVDGKLLVEKDPKDNRDRIINKLASMCQTLFPEDIKEGDVGDVVAILLQELHGRRHLDSMPKAAPDAAVRVSAIST